MAGDPRGCFVHLRSPRVARQYLDTREIMALEAEYGARSSFYFLAVEPNDPDRTYNIMDVKDDLRHVQTSGWEVGLHGSQGAHADLAMMIKEKGKVEAALGAPISGYRNHFLRFSVPLTWRLLQKAGFEYDTTLGYADCAGFRNGMCHPFKPFDLEAGTTIDIVEFPLMIMDASLFYNHMRLDAATAWDLVKSTIDTVEKLNGTLTILWHNTYMRGEHLKVYTKILDYCRERKAWMPTGKDLRDRAVAVLDG
jgi:peptidoglycan/xylan/chitin deacetylase (PgdA/CDA1 family)